MIDWEAKTRMIVSGEELVVVHRSGRGRRWSWVLRAVAVGGVALSLVGVVGSAAAQGGVEGGCPVVASAQGVQVMVVAEDQVFDEPSGVGVSVAQAWVNFGLSDSRGFASSPYPGELARSLPAVVWGPVGDGSGEPAPEYPGYAGSSFPGEPESRVDQPGNSLSARSSETSSRARAESGLSGGGADAASMVAVAESVVNPGALTGVAAARSDTEPLTFNDVLELGRVRSTVSAAVDARGTVKRESSLSIGRTMVAGQVVQITPRGVEAAGQTVPGPGSDPAEALEAAGIEVRYLAEEKSARGVLSAGVEVVVKQQSPLASGKFYRVHYTVGRAFAAADRVERPVGAGPVGGAVPGVVDGGDAGGVGDSGAPAGGPVAASVPEAAPAVAEGPPAPEAAPAPQVAVPAAWVGRPMDMGMAGFYLVLVCGAMAMVAGMTLLRVLGVRTRWTS